LRIIVHAPCAGTVAEIAAAVGARVEAGELVAVLRPEATG